MARLIFARCDYLGAVDTYQLAFRRSKFSSFLGAPLQRLDDGVPGREPIMGQAKGTPVNLESYQG